MEQRHEVISDSEEEREETRKGQRDEEEMSDEEGNPSPEVLALQRQVRKLTVLVNRQNDTIDLLRQTPRREVFFPSHSTPVSTPTKPLIKPRDVPQLTLMHLEGLEASARLQMFLEAVEQVTDEDQTRIQVAKGKVDDEIAILIHNQQTTGKINSWDDLKELLKQEFPVNFTVDQAWSELDSMPYEWEESPRAFTNHFICQYATLEGRFPKEKFPARDSTIKKKIYRGIPREIQAKVEAYLDIEYPLRKFLERVDYQRNIWLENNSFPNSVRPVKGVQNTQEDENQATEIKALANTVEKLTETVTKLNVTPTRESKDVKVAGSQSGQFYNKAPRPSCMPPRRKYCHHCNQSSHHTNDCWRNPRKGRCFDCQQPRCWRGNPNCPGRQPPENQ